MKYRTISEQIEDDKIKADWFISELVKTGIPKSAIATNDFNSSLVNRVYITIPYGQKNGGKNKGYQRWNNRTIKYAINFWNSRKS